MAALTAGSSLETVAAHWGLTRSRVDQIRREYRLGLPPRISRRTEYGAKIVRNQLIVAAIENSGASLTELGKQLGISRERVRQIYAKYGNGNVRERVDGAEVFSVIRTIRADSTIDSWTRVQEQIARRAGHPRCPITKALRELDMLVPLDRLLRLRRRNKKRRRIVEILQRVASETGHNPKSHGFLGGGQYGLSLTSIYRYFDTFAHALAAAGLPPNRAPQQYKKPKRNGWGYCKSQKHVPEHLLKDI